MKRKRGAQPGNRNALKHGFYSDQFDQVERQKLGLLPKMDLTGEIDLLRIQMYRYLMAETEALPHMDYETRHQALRTHSLAADTLSRLIRTQLMVNLGSVSPDNDLLEKSPPDSQESEERNE